MLIAVLPFLMSALTLGTVLGLTFVTSVVILTIPVFASRGTAQLLWFVGVGFVLTVELAVMVTLVALQSTGNLF